MKRIAWLLLRMGWWLGWIAQQLFGRRKMLRIAVVGDLSLQDPLRLKRAMDAAVASKPDVLIHVGDMHPGYDLVKNCPIPRTYAVPGNHDTEWDARMGDGWKRQWFRDEGVVQIVGMDNSKDSFGPADWDALGKWVDPTRPCMIVCHKALSPIVFPDGTESMHVMGEGQPNADAERLKKLVTGSDCLLVHGHFHGLALMRPA